MAAKTYWRGTHRTRSPEETMARLGPLAGALGITRLANVTGLDYLGIPVFMAVRPASRSLSVSQGKGLDDMSAAVSAFMEAAELAHAEVVELPRRIDTYARMKSRVRVADPARLPRRKGERIAKDMKIAWVEGVDLTDNAPAYVPFDLVHVRFERRRNPRSAGPFFRSSNGLASGNDWLEAVCAGIYEVIERDALTLWDHWPFQQRAARRLALKSFADPDCRALVDRLSEREMALAIWDITSDIGIPCFLCRLVEGPGNQRSSLGAFWGSGCHLNREVALSRAITEATQSRLTYIAGSRDDLWHTRYAEIENPKRVGLFDIVREHWEERQADHKLKNIRSRAGATFESDLETLLASLVKAGLGQVIAVDLTKEQFGVAVVRIVVPGLEPYDENHRTELGPRARRSARANV